MYTFNLFDIVFTLKSLKYPSPCFDIRYFITFNTNQTRSSSHGKLIHQISSNNSARKFSFPEFLIYGTPYHPLIYPCQLPPTKLKLSDFYGRILSPTADQNTPYTFQLVCPCSKCLNNPQPPNFNNWLTYNQLCK